MITIIDYGMGNMGSIENMLRRKGHKAEIASEPEQIAAASRLILPGVGAFESGMQHLNDSGLREVLHERVTRDKVPILGICLGMQLLFERSEEGELPGLGWISGEVIKFEQPSNGTKLRIPHMGWNTVIPRHSDGLFAGLDETSRFYFVHSYHVEGCPDEHIAGETDYGHRFTCAVQDQHIWGVQFHPEKSHHYGIQLLANFAGTPVTS
jgi:glutamine amidotransferase